MNIRQFIKKYGLEEFDETNINKFNDNVRVLVNGDIIGINENPKFLVENLRYLKRIGIINIYTCISWNIMENEINISTEAGRSVRPLYVINNNTFEMDDEIYNTQNLKWAEIILKIKIELILLEI